MVGEIEMYTHQGVCKYCGEIQPILAADQIDADLKISEKCSCGGYEKENRHEKMVMNLEKIIGGKADRSGFLELAGDRKHFVSAAAEAVFQEAIDKVTIKFEDTTITLNLTADGNVKIQRSAQKKVVAE